MRKVIQLRRGAGTALTKFQKEKVGKIAFIGGSITEMPKGYSFLTSEMIREMFPTSRLEFINAGISSTCSDTGSFRIGTDVFSKGKIDLLFIEFAVNDNQDGHLKPALTVRAMEGMVRQAYANNPEMDIVFIYTANESHNETYRQGKIPREIRAMEKVAKYYRIPTISFAQEVAKRLAEGEFDWAKDFGGVHPAPFGNQIYCDLIKELLENSPECSRAEIPEELIDENSFVNGTFVSPEYAEFDEGWTFGVPDWDSLEGLKRKQYVNVPNLYTEKPGSKLTFRFRGNCIGLYLTAGPDAGSIRYSIDGSPFKMEKLYHPFSAGLHYPYTKILADELSSGEHEFTLEVAKSRHKKSKGNAVRLVKFAVNSVAVHAERD